MTRGMALLSSKSFGASPRRASQTSTSIGTFQYADEDDMFVHPGAIQQSKTYHFESLTAKEDQHDDAREVGDSPDENARNLRDDDAEDREDTATATGQGRTVIKSTVIESTGEHLYQSIKESNTNESTNKDDGNSTDTNSKEQDRQDKKKELRIKHWLRYGITDRVQDKDVTLNPHDAETAALLAAATAPSKDANETKQVKETLPRLTDDDSVSSSRVADVASTSENKESVQESEESSPSDCFAAPAVLFGGTIIACANYMFETEEKGGGIEVILSKDDDETEQVDETTQREERGDFETQDANQAATENSAALKKIRVTKPKLEKKKSGLRMFGAAAAASGWQNEVFRYDGDEKSKSPTYSDRRGYRSPQVYGKERKMTAQERIVAAHEQNDPETRATKKILMWPSFFRPSAKESAFDGTPRHDWIDIETNAAIKVQAAFRRHMVMKDLERKNLSTSHMRNRRRAREYYDGEYSDRKYYDQDYEDGCCDGCGCNLRNARQNEDVPCFLACCGVGFLFGDATSEAPDAVQAQRNAEYRKKMKAKDEEMMQKGLVVKRDTPRMHSVTESLKETTKEEEEEQRDEGFSVPFCKRN